MNTDSINSRRRNRVKPHIPLFPRLPHVDRRSVVAALGSAVLAGIARPREAFAQSPKQARRIGVLTWWSEYDPEGQSQAIALAQGLAKLGWVDGQNIKIEYRRVFGESDRIDLYAKQLVDHQPDLLVGVATPAVTALLRATRTIPIVFTEVSDPVGSGFVETLSHPGGNATGFVDIEASLGGKWVELLKEIAPSMKRVGFMFNPKTAPGAGAYYLRPFEAAARTFGVEPIEAPVRDPADMVAAFAALAQQGGLILMPDAFVLSNRDMIIAQAARNKVPAIYPYRFFATGGGLISYGVGLTEQNRQAASYVDRILKGEKPADLPVQLPTQFELVINLKTAKALGVTVPPSLLSGAATVIE
jgi:putative tryptophan/tyrosine transport system substrate-binding protein